LASIDPCLDDEMGGAFAQRPSEVPLFVWWQSAIGEREPEAFWGALVTGKTDERVDHMSRLLAQGPNPHEAIVPPAFEKLLRVVLPSDPVRRL
jgi:hypothetical protein